jgi:hypothetical protein
MNKVMQNMSKTGENLSKNIGKSEWFLHVAFGLGREFLGDEIIQAAQNEIGKMGGRGKF